MIKPTKSELLISTALVFSLVAQAAIAQSADQKIAQYNASSTPVNAPSSVLVPINRNLEIGLSQSTGETGGVAALTLGGETIGLRLVGDASNKSQHLGAAAGFAVGNVGYFVGGVSSGREPISYPGIDQKMKGNSAFARLDLSNLSPNIRKIYVDALSQRTSSKTLSVTDAAFTATSVQDLDTFTRTTTTNGVDRTTIDFFGGRRNRLGLGGELNVADNGIFTAKVFHSNTKVLDESSSTTTGLVGYKHYMPQYRAYAGLTVDTDGQLTISGEKSFDDSRFSMTLNGFKNTKNAKNYGIYVGVRYALGDTSHNVGTRPDTSNAQLNETLMLNSIYNPKNYFGRVIQKQEHIVTNQTNVDVAKPVVVVPAVVPPAVVPPVVVPPAEPNPPPADILFNQTLSLGKFSLTCEAAGGLSSNTTTVSAPTEIGTLSCKDIAPSGGAPDTCTFAGSNANFTVSSTGVVTMLVNSDTRAQLDAIINITVTDVQGATYSEPITVNMIGSCLR